MFGVVRQLKELTKALYAISHSIDCHTTTVAAHLEDRSNSKEASHRTMFDLEPTAPPPRVKTPSKP